MIYTPEEKSRLQTLITAFESYINDHRYFDLLYSNKCGYVYLPLDDLDLTSALPVEIIQTANQLFEKLAYEFSNDVLDLFLFGEHNNVFLFPEELELTKQRMLPYLAKLPEKLRTYYTAQLDVVFDGD